jgi:hypothetical protein
VTFHTDVVALVVSHCTVFVLGVMFAAWRQLQRERIARWVRRTRWIRTL